MCRSFRLS
nr:unnamed protein product [Callosobruchus analis]